MEYVLQEDTTDDKGIKDEVEGILNNEVVERYRVNLKESMKGIVSCDITVEFKDGDELKLSNPNDAGDVSQKPVEKRAVELLINTRKELIDKGFKVVTDDKS